MANNVEIVVGAQDFASGVLGNVSTSLGALTKAVGIAGVAISGLGVLSVREFAQFESAFAGVRKTVEGSEADFKILSDSIRQMATEIPASADAISAVAESAGQLGIQKENIIEFSRVMIDLGNTTNLAGTEASQTLARLTNIMGTAQTEFDNLGSAIVDLGNNFATTEAEITDMALRLAGAGKIVGLTEAEVLGLSTALTSVGIRAELGGSAFSRVMADMASAVSEGGQELERFAEVAGTTGENFAKLFKEDTAEALVTFVEGLGKVKEEGGNVFKVLEGLGLQNIRVRDTLLRASGAGDLMRQAIETSSEAFRENTALTIEAEKRYETLASQWQIMKNSIREMALSLGEQLAPATKDAVKAISAFALDSAKIIKVLPEIIAVTLNAIGDMFTKFFNDPEFFTLMLRNAGRFSVAMITGFGNMLTEIGAIVLKTAGEMFVPLIASAKFASDSIASLFTDEVAPSFAETMEQMNKDMGVLTGGIDQNVANIKNSFSDAFADTAVIFGDFEEVPELDAFQAKVEDILGSVSDTIGEFSDTNKDKIFEAIGGGEAGQERLDETKEMWETWMGDWIGSWADTQAILQETSQATWDTFQQGVGDAVGQAIVFGADLQKAFRGLMKNIASSVISSLVQIGVQRLAQAIFGQAVNAKEASSRMAVLSAETFAGAFASTVAIPIIGPALAPAVASASQASMLAGAIASAGAGASTGAGIGGAFADGIDNIPNTGSFFLHEGERVVSPKANKDLTEFLDGGGNGGGGGLFIENLNMFPEGTIFESLLNMDKEDLLEFVTEALLPALNVAGRMGEKTTLAFSEDTGI